MVLILVALAGGGFAYWQLHQPPEGRGLTLYGNVEVRQVNLGFRVGGRVQTMLVDEGDAVVADQPLGQLDPVPYQQELEPGGGGAGRCPGDPGQAAGGHSGRGDRPGSSAGQRGRGRA